MGITAVEDDLCWGEQLDQMTKKASKKIWTVGDEKMGLNEKIINFWKAEGRVHLEAASVVWTSGLQKVQNVLKMCVNGRYIKVLEFRTNR